MADYSDRHYSLVANNQHPIQLMVYDIYNKEVRKKNDP